MTDKYTKDAAETFSVAIEDVTPEQRKYAKDMNLFEEYQGNSTGRFAPKKPEMHKHDEDCMCVLCKPLERPCDCDFCKDLHTHNPEENGMITMDFSAAEERMAAHLTCPNCGAYLKMSGIKTLAWKVKNGTCYCDKCMYERKL